MLAELGGVEVEESLLTGAKWDPHEREGLHGRRLKGSKRLG